MAEQLRKRKAREASGTKEILAEMKVWRKAHLKATFVEIEAEMEARIKELREQVLAEVMEMSTAAEAEEHAFHCPGCGAEMERRGKHTRRLQGTGGSEVELVSLTVLICTSHRRHMCTRHDRLNVYQA